MKYLKIIQFFSFFLIKSYLVKAYKLMDKISKILHNKQPIFRIL